MKPALNKIALIGTLTMALSGVVLATPQDDLRSAVGYNRPTLVQGYVVQGVDPNLEACDGTPLLVDALKEKNIEVTEAFIHAKNVDFERTNAVGKNALVMAVYQGLLPMMKLMAETYDVGVNKTGWTALHYVATNRYDDIVKYLFDHAAHTDVENPNAITPLMMVVVGGYITTVKLLLDEGTDMNSRNQQKMDVIDFARRYHQDETAVELESCRYELAEQFGKPASAPVLTAAVPPSVRAAAPDVSTPMPSTKHDAGTPGLAGRDTIDTPTNMLFDSNR